MPGSGDIRSYAAIFVQTHRLRCDAAFVRSDATVALIHPVGALEGISDDSAQRGDQFLIDSSAPP
jgi:hypothetical protein